MWLASFIKSSHGNLKCEFIWTFYYDLMYDDYMNEPAFLVNPRSTDLDIVAAYTEFNFF